LGQHDLLLLSIYVYWVSNMIFDEFLIKSHITNISDWPIAGVNFRDISPLFKNPKTARMVTDAFSQRYIDQHITHIGALDARGFLLGSNLAYVLNLPLILIRKPGKLPGPVDRVDYSSEYADNALELQKNSVGQGDRVLLIDDLIATGGTQLAAAQLIRGQGAEVAEAATIIDLVALGGSQRLADAGIPVFNLCIF
jgi:adenine phosphoribosyltransferase